MVDSTVECELICMLDVYQGYHQVPLTREDQEKVSFVTTDGTFCYKVMPFGLKNAGATYQRMMNKYQPRSAIKAQALADFVAEVQNLEPESSWKVYVDGSFARQGSGIGILLISPREDRVQLSIRLDHRATNNEAEYEALIAGLQAARHVGATKVLIHSDSQLATQQLNGTFEINSSRLRLYAEAFERLKASFQEVIVCKIPRSENQIADELTKLASALTPIVTNCPIEQVSLVVHVDRARGIPFLDDWRAPIVKLLQSGILTGNHDADRSLRRRAARFTLVGEQLYKKAFSRPLLKCVGSEDAEYILQEELKHRASHWNEAFWKVLAGSCGLLLQMGGSRTASKDNRSMVKKFIWQNIICRFSIPRRLVSDNGRQFTGQELKEWCEGYGIQQAFTSVAYPQSNGQAEVTNREILRILRARLDHMGGSWMDELPSVLWALHTTPKEGTGVTLFHLVYDGEAVVPVEIEVESDRVLHYDEGNEERRLMELDMVNEVHDKAAARLTVYRQRMRKNYNRRVIPRSFQSGDLVWKKVRPVGDVKKLEAP
ncbi:uncharacterized protein LOC121990751 [Zingiber officinale]|uniref:uncharacterized protein LOC121990751 n=1 Tax=Zingiber officinale TaxID=94328 RepID=UPI001C4DB648|nr:uncharacterized protein LOC121990751 [Zingiber officinale]